MRVNRVPKISDGRQALWFQWSGLLFASSFSGPNDLLLSSITGSDILHITKANKSQVGNHLIWFQLGFYLLWFHCALVTGLNALMLLFISLALVLLFFTFTCGPHFFVMQMNKLIG